MQAITVVIEKINVWIRTVVGKTVGEISEWEKEGGWEFVKASYELAVKNIKQAWAISVDKKPIT